MYAVNLHGSGVATQVMAALLKHVGFEDFSTTRDGAAEPELPVYTLPANQTRILRALDRLDELTAVAHQPDREQIRLAPSDYLLAELPLGNFYRDRYGAPLINVDHADLLDKTQVEIPNLEPREAELTIDTATSTLSNNATHTLWHATCDGAPSKANVTYLGEHSSIAWFCTTPSQHHAFFLLPQDISPAELRWNPLMGELAKQASKLRPVDLNPPNREYWIEGNWVFLGHACHHPSVIQRESWFSGIEDAWVLSRMMLNYEEDIGDGLAEYERYRRPRLERIRQANLKRAERLLAHSAFNKLTRNVAIALRSRFLPEFAMQDIDWFHQYDCIKGFR